MANGLTPDTGGGSRPVPDPTILTTEALNREVQALRELLAQRISALQELIEVEVHGQMQLRNEELKRINENLVLVERQRVEQKSDTKLAVDAALSAQKEAVKEQTTASERSIAKSEAATTKAIEQQGSTFSAALDGQRRELIDLKDRLTVIESRRLGEVERHDSVSSATGLYIAAIGGCIAFFGVISAIAIAILR